MDLISREGAMINEDSKNDDLEEGVISVKESPIKEMADDYSFRGEN